MSGKNEVGYPRKYIPAKVVLGPVTIEWRGKVYDYTEERGAAVKQHASAMRQARANYRLTVADIDDVLEEYL